MNASQDDTLDLLKDFLPDVAVPSCRLKHNCATKSNQTSSKSTLVGWNKRWRGSSSKHSKSTLKPWPLYRRSSSS